VKLTEDEIRKITLSAISELGDNATPELVKKTVASSVNKIESEQAIKKTDDLSSGKVILTSFGLNRPGVVAKITTKLSDDACDLQDISQKIMDDFYTLIMIIDISASPKNLSEIQSAMNTIAEELKIKIYLQHEEIFRQMHRI
jgi:ACT domain-containing protein